MNAITVTCVRYTTKFNKTTIYIGRGNNSFVKHGSALLTPYLMGTDTRLECLRKYREYLLAKFENPGDSANIEFRRIMRIARKYPIKLVCHCAPLPCHGDVIKELLEIELNKGESNEQLKLL